MKKTVLYSGLMLLVITAGFYVLGENQETHFLLRNNEVIDIDFGFQKVELGDFKAESEITFKNPYSKSLEIVNIRKSCSCHTVQLEPEDIIPPKDKLRLRFVHSDATNQKGGFFHDRIMLEMLMDNQPVLVQVNYSGFVNKLSHTIPDKVQFHNLRRFETPKIKKTVVFLSLLKEVNGNLVILPPHEIDNIITPSDMTVSLASSSEIPELMNICPNTILPPKVYWENPRTETQQLLKDFFSKKPIESNVFWQPILLTVKLDRVEGSANHVIHIKTNHVTVDVPIFVEVLPDITFAPEEIALMAKSDSSAVSHIRSNTETPLEIRSVSANQKEIFNFKIEKIDDYYSRVHIKIENETTVSEDISDTLRVITNQGEVEVPYKLFRSS